MKPESDTTLGDEFGYDLPGPLGKEGYKLYYSNYWEVSINQ